MQRPNATGQTRRYCWRRLNARMLTDEVIIHEVERYGTMVVQGLLREGIGQPGIPPHLHPHREVIAFNVRR
jgi:hypothetical protein